MDVERNTKSSNPYDPPQSESTTYRPSFPILGTIVSAFIIGVFFGGTTFHLMPLLARIPSIFWFAFLMAVLLVLLGRLLWKQRT